jgi:hypothetical protein
MPDEKSLRRSSSLTRAGPGRLLHPVGVQRPARRACGCHRKETPSLPASSGNAVGQAGRQHFVPRPTSRSIPFDGRASQKLEKYAAGGFGWCGGRRSGRECSRLLCPPSVQVSRGSPRQVVHRDGDNSESVQGWVKGGETFVGKLVQNETPSFAFPDPSDWQPGSLGQRALIAADGLWNPRRYSPPAPPSFAVHRIVKMAASLRCVRVPG